MRRNRGPVFRSNVSTVPDSLSLIRSFNVETNPTRPVRPSPLTASTIPDMPLDLLDRIRSFPLFLSAPDTFLSAIGKHLWPQVHPPHDHILAEGDEAKAMYWLVRGAVAVTSRDGEATYAELKPGAFFGEIGILMDVPRTATIIARTKCLLVVLKKEDLQAELPNFPDMEKAIIEEAQERLTILNKKRIESGFRPKLISSPFSKGEKAHDLASNEFLSGDLGVMGSGSTTINTKKRKSPSPQTIEDSTAGSALGSGFVNIRRTLKELPLFSNLPPDILHLLGLSAQPKTYAPFTDIILQNSPGNEIYFIVRGEAEVIQENSHGMNDFGSYIRPRLKEGQYFGEVASLSLAPTRTATVRAITTVECLMIRGEILEELWRRCSPDIRQQVETTAMARIGRPDEDSIMADVGDISSNNCVACPNISSSGALLPKANSIPWEPLTPSKPNSTNDKDTMEPLDPDPFLSVDIDNMKTRSRRGSWAPSAEVVSSENSPSIRSSTPKKFAHDIILPDPSYRPKRPKTDQAQKSHGILPDGIIILIFSSLDIYQLMRLRQVSSHWSTLLTSPMICHTLDLSLYNRHVTDSVLIHSILPFVNHRATTVDLSNCYHVTDQGFSALSAHCGAAVKTWKMKSVWDISANAILEMTNGAKNLEEIDLSNCRKVSDNLLTRIVGWVVSEPIPTLPSHSKSSKPLILNRSVRASPLTFQSLPIGTVIGCSKLKNLTLSYCKHVSDRSMAHLAVHAHGRLESIDLTRCTTITDAGFQHWSMYRFEKLRKLVLADCTYLSDNAIVYLCNAARGLRELDLSFCCALSDTATEVLSLGCPQLSILKLSFCGSAVSDSSLRSIALHLNNLKHLSVRGCVRVTGLGVEAVVEGCNKLELFDVSQCKNLLPWLDSGGEERSRRRWRGANCSQPRFETQKGSGATEGSVLSLR
ncbi:hypothetical protein K3495_g2072 [Podosphaera aphanis]|nr:hypothetical protein K3495_g2072 [Podosphaera aphanis]